MIYTNGTGAVNPDATYPAHSTEHADRLPVSPAAPTPSTSDRSDKVQISDAGRALAARVSDQPDNVFDPARAANIRKRILSGAYDAIEVVDDVARRLLASGDL